MNKPKSTIIVNGKKIKNPAYSKWWYEHNKEEHLTNVKHNDYKYKAEGRTFQQRCPIGYSKYVENRKLKRRIKKLEKQIELLKMILSDPRLGAYKRKLAKISKSK